MQVAIIPPVAHMELAKTDFHLVLAHLYQEKTYVNFYREQKGYKILDNGAAEGFRVTNPDAYIAIARELDVQEIVVPDVIGDWQQTASLAARFKKWAHEHPEFRYMGVVQGETGQDLVRCTLEFAQHGYIRVLGIPRHLLKKQDKFARYAFIKALEKQFPDYFEAIHCLGAGLWCEEVEYLKETSCRSIDTSLPVVLAMEGVDISKKMYMSRPEGYFSQELRDRLLLADKNIDTYVKWAS